MGKRELLIIRNLPYTAGPGVISSAVGALVLRLSFTV